MSENKKLDFVAGLQDAARQNPISTALIGAGVLWMLTGGSKITAAAALVGQTARATAGGVGRAVDSASDATSAALEGVHSLGTRAAAQAREAATPVSSSVVELSVGTHDAIRRSLPSVTSSAISPMIENLRATLERQPLVLGGIGLVLGSAIAAALPETRMESDVLGDTANRVTRQLREGAGDAVSQVKDTASRVFEAVKDEAAVQGLTVEDARAAAEGVRNQISGSASNAFKPNGA